MASTVTLEGKNVVEFIAYLKGVDPKIEDVQNYTFNDVALDNGTEYKDLTFSQLQALVVSLEGKNIASITYETKS
jgi:hypothetical protein